VPNSSIIVDISLKHFDSSKVTFSYFNHLWNTLEDGKVNCSTFFAIGFFSLDPCNMLKLIFSSQYSWHYS
jgi:hypothetical protein